MLRRNKEDREVDRVLVVADLENGWESIIGWAISRSQQGDSIFILNVISTAKHAERINRDAAGGARDASESADEEELLLRGRLRLLSETLKMLSKSVVGVKVMASMQVVPRTRMGPAIVNQVESMELTRVVINAGGYSLQQDRGPMRHWAVLIGFLERRLSCECLIAIVDNNRLAEVKRGQVVPSSSEEESEVQPSDAEQLANLRRRAAQIQTLRAPGAACARDSGTKGSGDESEAPRASDLVRPRSARERAVAVAARAAPLRSHSSDGTNRRQLKGLESEGEILYSTAEESEGRSKTPALRPVHMHGHEMADRTNTPSRPAPSERGSDSADANGNARLADSGVLGDKEHGTPQEKVDNAGNGGLFGLAELLFGTQRGQAKRGAGHRAPSAGEQGAEEEAKAVDAGIEARWQDGVVSGAAQPGCFVGPAPGQAVPRQTTGNSNHGHLAALGMAQARSMGEREAREWLGQGGKARDAEEFGAWRPWSKAEDKKKQSAPALSAKAAKMEDAGLKITWLSFLGVAPLRPSKQQGAEAGSPTSSALKPAIVKLEERVEAVLEKKGALQVSEEVSVMGWPLNYMDAKEQKARPRPKPVAKSVSQPLSRKKMEPIAEGRQNPRGPGAARRAPRGQQQKAWSGIIPRKIKSYMRVKKGKGSRARDGGKQSKGAGGPAQQDGESEADENDGWAPVGITYSAAVRKIDHINNWLMDIPTAKGSEDGGARSELGFNLREEAPADWSLRRGSGVDPSLANHEASTTPIRGYSSSFAERQKRLPVIRTRSKALPESPTSQDSSVAQVYHEVEPVFRSTVLEDRPSTGDAGTRWQGSGAPHLRQGSLQGSPQHRPSAQQESRQSRSFVSGSKPPPSGSGAPQQRPGAQQESRRSQSFVLGPRPSSRSGTLQGRPSAQQESRRSQSFVSLTRPPSGSSTPQRHPSAQQESRRPQSFVSEPKPPSGIGTPQRRPSAQQESRVSQSFVSESKPPPSGGGTPQHWARPWSPSPRESRRYTLGSMIQLAREGSLNGTPRSMMSKGDRAVQTADGPDWSQPPSQQFNFRPWSKGGRGRAPGRLAALAQQQEALGWGSGIGASHASAKAQSPDIRPASLPMRGPQYSGEFRRGRD